jgi:hypothetical protein
VSLIRIEVVGHGPASHDYYFLDVCGIRGTDLEIIAVTRHWGDVDDCRSTAAEVPRLEDLNS